MTNSMKWAMISIAGIVAVGLVVALIVWASAGESPGVNAAGVASDTTSTSAALPTSVASTTTTTTTTTTTIGDIDESGCDPEQAKHLYSEYFDPDSMSFDSCEEILELVWELDTRALVDVWVDACYIDGVVGFAENGSPDLVDLLVVARLFDSSGSKLAEVEVEVNEVAPGESVDWFATSERDHPTADSCNASLWQVKPAGNAKG